MAAYDPIADPGLGSVVEGAMDAHPTIAFPATLASVEVLQDRGLRIVVEERTGRGPLQDDAEGIGLQGREVVSHTVDRTFEIVWHVAVCFAVRGDPFPKGGPSSDTIVEVAAPGGFLSWVESQSHAEPDYVAAMGGDFEPDPERRLRHWIVVSSEASFDVAAIEPPVVREIATPAEVVGSFH
jgi:hypothetical protein